MLCIYVIYEVSSNNGSSVSQERAGASNSSDPRRRISSPRTSPMKRNIKKFVRYDNDKKTKIMENIMYRLDATNNRISKLQTKSHSLKQQMGSKKKQFFHFFVFIIIIFGL